MMKPPVYLYTAHFNAEAALNTMTNLVKDKLDELEKANDRRFAAPPSVTYATEKFHVVVALLPYDPIDWTTPAES